jgi:hypothetical protein
VLRVGRRGDELYRVFISRCMLVRQSYKGLVSVVSRFWERRQLAEQPACYQQQSHKSKEDE